MKKKIQFIVNPISGTHSKRTIIDNINHVLNTDIFDFEILTTEYAGHAKVYAENGAKNGVDIIVAVGGDGTVNEVASALVNTDTALGIIPCGSGNGLARHLQIPLTSKRAIAVLNQKQIEKLDYGLVCDKPFFCTCGMGFDAYISYKFTEAKRRGLITYLEQSLAEWLRYEPETYIIEDETKRISYKAFLITCANASEYGNHAYIAPRATMDDGLMDVTIVEPFNAFEAPQLALALFNKTLKPGSHVKMFQTRKLTIHRQKEDVIHRDGDPIKAGKDVTVEIIHKGINVVINPKARNKKETFLQSISSFIDDLQSKGLVYATKNSSLSALNKNLLEKLRNR